MGHIDEFYSSVMSDPQQKEAFRKILGNRDILNADDAQLREIGKLAEKAGYDISMEDIKKYLNQTESELQMEDLDAVAGGGKGDKYYTDIIVCQIGGGAYHEQ